MRWTRSWAWCEAKAKAAQTGRQPSAQRLAHVAGGSHRRDPLNQHSCQTHSVLSSWTDRQSRLFEEGLTRLTRKERQASGYERANVYD